MDSDLADRYNEGIVPPPDLPQDVPQLRRPSEQATSGADLPNRGVLIVVGIIILIIVLFACLLLVASGSGLLGR